MSSLSPMQPLGLDLLLVCLSVEFVFLNGQLDGWMIEWMGGWLYIRSDVKSETSWEKNINN